MKKYTIDDLIIDDPTSEAKKSKRKSKGKSTTIIALIVMIVIAGIFLAKNKMGTPDDINITKEIKIEDPNIKELLEPKQEKMVTTEQEAQKAADELSIAITELDSLALPKTEPINHGIVSDKTEELVDQNQEILVPAQKVADKASVSAADTKVLEPSTAEPKDDEIVTAEAKELPEQKHETIVPAEQEVQKAAGAPSITDAETNSLESSATEPKSDETAAGSAENLQKTEQNASTSVDQELQKITDILATVSPAETPADKSKIESDESTDNAISNDQSIPNPSTNSIKELETDRLKNSTPEVIDSQEKPKAKEEKTEQPKHETESEVTKVPDTKTEDIASKKVKVKSEPKPKPKQDGFFNRLTSKNKYYILVGSNPSSRFLSKIKNAKLRYVVRMSNGKRSVFIGPYSSSSNARRSIGKVQKVTGIKGVVVKAK